MSDTTTTKPTTADKLLASIRRGAEVTPDALRRLGVEDRPGDKAGDKPGEPRDEPAADAAPPKTARKAAKPARRDDAAVQRNVDFDVSTGRGVKHLTIRVPKEMAADLSLLAMRNKLSENGGPTTINELGIRALRELLDAAA